MFNNNYHLFYGRNDDDVSLLLVTLKEYCLLEYLH